MVDHLIKLAHFIPVKTTYSLAKFAGLYWTKIVCLHGVLKTIMSNSGSQPTIEFWEALHASMGTTLVFNTTYVLKPKAKWYMELQIYGP